VPTVAVDRQEADCGVVTALAEAVRPESLMPPGDSSALSMRCNVGRETSRRPGRPDDRYPLTPVAVLVTSPPTANV